MNTTDQRILLQLARRGLATSMESISVADGRRAWAAIENLENEFRAAMEFKDTPPKEPTNG